MRVNSEIIVSLLLLILPVPGSLGGISGLKQQWPNQRDIGCFVPGECIEGNTVGLFSLETAEECLDRCKDSASCLYFTHYRVGFVCLLLSECNGGLSTANCDDCVSGDVTCEPLECDEPGAYFEQCVTRQFEGEIPELSHAIFLDKKYKYDIFYLFFTMSENVKN